MNTRRHLAGWGRSLWASLILLLALGTTSTAMAQSVGLTDIDGHTWLVDVGGTADGTTTGFGGTGALLGTGGPVLQFPRLCVRTSAASGPCAAAEIFAPGAATQFTFELGDRQIALAGDTIGGIEVSRRIFVPSNSPIGGWARGLDTFVNSTGAPITFRIRYGTVVTGAAVNQLGYGANTAVVGSSSGDPTWTIEDTWVTVDDVDGSGVNAFGMLLFTPDAEVVPTQAALDPYGAGDVADGAWEYGEITLLPGQQRTVMHFYVQDTTRSDVNMRLAALAEHPPEVFTGMSEVQIGGLTNVAPRRPRVLLLTSDDTGAWTNVKETLTLTRSFDPADIDVVDVSDEPLPTLATLETYDVVVCWLRQAHSYRVDAGNLLADYVDGGGDVVVLPFTFGGAVSLQGRWANGGYSPITQGTDPVTSAATIGTRYQPTHPLLVGVNSIGNAVNRAGSSQVANGASRIADWSDGRVMLATLDRPGSAGRIVGVGLYPVSDRNRADQQNFWDASTDGDYLLRNAIYWADGYNALVLPGPQPVADAGGPYMVDEGFATPLAGLAGSLGHRLTFSWDLDDDGVFGEDSNERSANPVFRAFDRGGPDIQPVTLRVTDRLGRFDEASSTIEIVNRPPRVETVTLPMQLVEGQEGTFTATASDPFAGDTVSIRWDFDDGGVADGASVTHTFANQAIYDIQTIADDGDDTDVRITPLMVLNANPIIEMLDVPSTGLEGEELSFGVTASDPGVEDTLTVRWDFGTQTVEGANVTWTWPNDGMYTVRVTVEDGEGGVAEAEFTVEIANVPPRIETFVLPMVGNEGEALPFMATVSDPGGDAVQVSWSFGDNSPEAVGLSVTHAYGDNGTWTVVATADDGLAQHSRLGSVIVLNAPPRITGILGINSVVVGEPVTLTVVYDDPGFWDTHTITWDLGPAGTATGPSATATWNALGAVTISVTVTDDEGDSDTETREVLVRGVPPTITSFEVTASGDEGDTFNFNVTAELPSCPELTYEWAFGDGGVAEGMSVSHVYVDDGNYNAEVAVVCAATSGLSVRGREIVVLNVPPSLGSLEGPPAVREGVEATFSVAVNDPGQDTFTWTWTVGDQEIMTDTGSLTWTFEDDTTVLVSVVVRDDDGGESAAGPLEVSVFNGAPACGASAPATTVTVRTPPVHYETSVVATDVPADMLDWRLAEGPMGMVIFNDGRVQWDVTEAQYELGQVSVVAVVDDDDGGSCRVEWTIAVEFADTDGDGIPDYWEVRYGLDPDDASDAALDGDDDGLTNLQEYEGRTNPNLYDGVPAPRLLYPVGGDVVGSLLPEFLIENVHFDQPVTVAIEVYRDEALTDLAFELALEQDPSGTTTFVPPSPLEENAQYWWRGRGVVADLDSRWSRVERFRVDVANEAPLAPVLERPEDGHSVDDARPTLVVTNTTDPDSTVLTYEFEVYSNSDLRDQVEAADGVEEGALGSTRWRLEAALTEDVTYYWRARARDDAGLAGPWSEVWSFVVNLDNRTPNAPVIASPVDGEELELLSPTAHILEIGDDDGDAVVLVWQLGLEGEFSPPAFEGQMDEIPESREVTFALPELLDNGYYTFRARVDDPFSSSEWASVSFLINLANDPPGVPTLESPAAGALVDEALPTFVVGAALDPDRDQLYYDIFVYADGVEEPLLQINVLGNEAGGAIWTVPTTTPLADGAYTWTARAIDEHGLSGELAERSSFTVEVPPVTLTPPVPISPVDETWQVGEPQAFVWQNAQASDASALLYTLELHAIEEGVDGLGEAILTRSGIEGDASGSTTVTLDEPLDVGSYAWLVRATSTTAGTVESNPAFFVVGGGGGSAGGNVGGSDCACVQVQAASVPGVDLAIWAVLGLIGVSGLIVRRRR